MTDGVVVVLLAAGAGERLGGGLPKAFARIGGRSLLWHAARAAQRCREADWIVVAAPEGREDLAHAVVEPLGAHAVVTGGTTRQASVRAALAVIPEDLSVVICHDAARPLASSALFAAVLKGLAGSDAVDGCIPVVPVPDTVKRVRDGIVVGTEERGELGLAQTPQAFRTPALRDAHARAVEADLHFTDDAAVLEWAGYRVGVIAGEPDNFKITTPEDLERAEALLRSSGGSAPWEVTHA